MERAKEHIKNKRPDLLEHFTSNCGFGVSSGNKSAPQVSFQIDWIGVSRSQPLAECEKPKGV